MYIWHFIKHFSILGLVLSITRDSEGNYGVLMKGIVHDRAIPSNTTKSGDSAIQRFRLAMLLSQVNASRLQMTLTDVRRNM